MNKHYALVGGTIGAGLIVITLLGVWAVKSFPKPAPALTNDQIIAETKKCEAASMKSSQIINGLTYDVIKVICEPRDK